MTGKSKKDEEKRTPRSSEKKTNIPHSKEAQTTSSAEPGPSEPLQGRQNRIPAALGGPPRHHEGTYDPHFYGYMPPPAGYFN